MDQFEDVNFINTAENSPTKDASSSVPFRSKRNVIQLLHKHSREGNEKQLKLIISKIDEANFVNKPNEDGLAPLHLSARFHNYECCCILVEDGKADVNIANAFGATPLIFASRYKRQNRKFRAINETEDVEIDSKQTTSIIQYLIKNNADVNRPDIYKCTPLHYAAMRGNEDAAYDLITAANIDINKTDNEGMTALHLACTYDHEKIVDLLITNRAELFCKDNMGDMPLHFACSEGNCKIIKLLMDAMANATGYPAPEQHLVKSQSYMHDVNFEEECEEEEMDEPTQIEVERTNVLSPKTSRATVASVSGEAAHNRAMMNEMNNDHEIPLHLAVKNGHREAAKICIEKGADVNSRNQNKQTPLHFACLSAKYELVDLLVQKGAKLNLMDNNQQTPLHLAAKRDNPKIVNYLLKKNASASRKRDIESLTPFLWAATNDNTEIIDMFIKMGCYELSDVDKNMKSAMYLAVSENLYEIVQKLVEIDNDGIFKNLYDVDGNSPLHLAASKGYLKIVKFLLSQQYDVGDKNDEEQTPLHLAAKNGRVNVVALFIENDDTRNLVNDEDEDSNTPLHLAATSGHPKVIEKLMEGGADINARNCHKWTALDCAAQHGNRNACLMLLEYDAPINARDKSNITPLFLACKGGHMDVVSLLLEWDADVGIRCVGEPTDPMCGYNCLDIAIENGHKGCVKAILQSPSWSTALRNQTQMQSRDMDTPMRRLIKKMPDMAEIVLSKCSKQNEKHCDMLDYAITFNYEFIDDAFSNWCDREEDGSVKNIYKLDDTLEPTAMRYSKNSKIVIRNHPVTLMAQFRRERLLTHPLVTRLMDRKWAGFASTFYYLNLFIYCLFFLFLAIYMTNAEAPYTSHKSGAAVNTNISACMSMAMLQPNKKLNQVADICKYPILFLSSFGIVKELLQFCMNPRHYFHFDNLMEWAIYLLSFVTVLDMNDCQRSYHWREHWQWQTGAVAIFLACMNLILFMRKTPHFGIFVVMFTDVFLTFAKFFVVFGLFILAFTFGFYSLLHNQVAFKNFGYALIKTTVMMIGEFEYDNLFYDQFSSSDYNKKVYYQVVTGILFVVFMFLMSIILMNLLVGLAVDDIKAVQENAKLTRLGMKVQLALEMEGLMPLVFQREKMVRKEIITPNQHRSISGLFTRKTRGLIMSEKMDPEPNQFEALIEMNDENNEQLNQIKSQIVNTENHIRLINKNLQRLMLSNNVDNDLKEEEDQLDEES